MSQLFRSLYFQLTVECPRLTLAVVALFIVSAVLFIDDFKLDASSDSLVLENDADLRYYQSVSARYGSDDFLVITYSPKGRLLADETLADIRALRDKLAAMERVESVVSLLDVPLINSPKMTFQDIRREVRTLESEATDRALAEREFQESPLYRNLIVSGDGRTTALQVFFQRDERYQALREQRNGLREKRLRSGLSPEEAAELEEVGIRFKRYTSELLDQEQRDIAEVRRILDRHRGMARIHLGGVPMIVSDMIDFIRNDIRVFGLGVFCFLVVLLSIAFRQLRWIVTPMLVCSAAGIGMVGYLGLLEWRVTVVSSNFISLLFIITLSLMVHLIVRYEELLAESPDAGQRWLVMETINSKAVPSFYTTITTMVAFASLIVSNIRPVIDFGWMMVLGIGMAFILAFLTFPAALAGLRPARPLFGERDITAAITGALARLNERHGGPTLLLYVFLSLASLVGISQLEVENRFIDYFKESTEIHQGMLLIDRELGGTIPLDVIIDPDREFLESLKEEAFEEEEPFEEDDFEFEGEMEEGLSGTSFWFNIFQLEQVGEVHDYLEQLPETGKVLSLATTMSLLKQLNGGEPLDNMTLAVMYKRLPEGVKESLFDSYMATDGNQVRFGIRVIDSDPELRRDSLLRKIRSEMAERFGFEPERVHLSGMLVLYNNVLQSLFKSQILTISVVFLAIFCMFLLLFRSPKLSAIGVVPTIVAAGLILGLMGWLGIPLDIMTITIAAITIGIGVDDTIHYIHRFSEEFPVDRDYLATMRRCHASVGRAIYYTSITITLGFSILALSNFIPTIYFGLLTGVAMIVALVANLTLLPLLIIRFKPMG